MARTSLKDQKVAEADVVSGNGDSVGSVARFGDRYTARGWTSRASSTYGNVNLLFLIMVMVMTAENMVCSTVKAMTEGVIMT